MRVSEDRALNSIFVCTVASVVLLLCLLLAVAAGPLSSLAYSISKLMEPKRNDHLLVTGRMPPC